MAVREYRKSNKDRYVYECKYFTINRFGYQGTIKIAENSLLWKYGRKPAVYAPACCTFALGKKANLQSYGNLTSDQNRP